METSGTWETQAVLDQLLPVLKGLVKTGYNVYMTLYGSEFITVVFNGLHRRNSLQDFPAFDSPVSVYLGGGSGPPPLHSLLRSVLFFSLAKGVSSEDSLISSHISDLGANKPN